MRVRTIVSTAALACWLAPAAHADRPTAAQRCAADLAAASAHHVQCRLDAESRYAARPDASRRSAALVRCSRKLTGAFARARARYGASCVVTEPASAFDAYLAQCSDVAANAAGGGALPDCAGDRATCEALPPAPILKTGQTTRYGAGSDGDLQRGVPRGFVDNGDGTITDTSTGLTWEKKSRDGSIHDQDDLYVWGDSDPPYGMNGTVVTTFLATLNSGGGFAGHTDWRLPNVFELESLRNLQVADPSTCRELDAECAPGCGVLACSCTASLDYWTSTSYADDPQRAWIVSFDGGFTSLDFKSIGHHARAVRGGS